jgi:hypothetical protein
MMKERTNATEAFYQTWVSTTTHIITFSCQLNKQQKKCKNINVIILDKAKTLHFLGQINVQERLLHQRTNDQVRNAGGHQQDLAPYRTVFHQFFTQRKAYRDNRTANSGFDSAAHINDIPTNRSLVSTSSDFTTHHLYIESLEESLAAGQEYVTKECAPTLDKPDPAYLLRTELDAQRKQFDLIMKKNSTLLAAMAKGNGGGGGSGIGGGGDGGGGGNRRHDRGTKVMCPNCNKLVIHAAADCFTLPANKDKIPTW